MKNRTHRHRWFSLSRRHSVGKSAVRGCRRPAIGRFGIALAFAGVFLPGCRPQTPHDTLFFQDMTGSVLNLPVKGQQTMLVAANTALAPECNGISHIRCYGFQNETVDTSLQLFYDGHPREVNQLSALVKTRLLWKVKPAPGTKFTGILRETLDYCRNCHNRVFIIILTDGEVDYEDYASVRQLAAQIKGMPNFGAILMLPIVDGKIRQRLERDLLKPLQGQLFIAGLEDLEEKIRLFDMREQSHP